MSKKRQRRKNSFLAQDLICLSSVSLCFPRNAKRKPLDANPDSRKNRSKSFIRQHERKRFILQWDYLLYWRLKKFQRISYLPTSTFIYLCNSKRHLLTLSLFCLSLCHFIFIPVFLAFSSILHWFICFTLFISIILPCSHLFLTWFVSKIAHIYLY